VGTAQYKDEAMEEIFWNGHWTNERSRGGSVSIATGYGLDGPSLTSGRGKKFFFTPERPNRFLFPLHGLAFGQLPISEA
jgi:hypothetical protein